ncbi:hypothetical protein Agub_g5064, partial [Astrephomene gubernaculifera]
MFVTLPAANGQCSKSCFRARKKPFVECHAAGPQNANERAFERYLRNRVKQLGTILPPSPDAPEPDMALLWGFLGKHLAAGITNEAVIIPKSDVAAAGPGGSGRGRSSTAGKAARDGVVIARPKLLPASARTVPLPIPGWAPAPTGLAPAPSANRHSTSAGSGSNSTSPLGTVHVFWDVESAHPGDSDPRVVATEVLRIARSLGRLAGCYAYATRQAWAWVPSHFVATYAPGGRPGDASRADEGCAGEGGPAGAQGRSRCPVCGQPVASAQLQQHMRRVHPDKSSTSLAGGAVTPAAAALPASGRGASSSKGGGSGKGSKAAAPVNTQRTGLGAVREYYSSSGEVYRPPAGHQLSLKYVLQREGFEPRVVQNADGASDRAVNGGIDRLLAALRAGRAKVGEGDNAAGAAAECTLLIVSGSTRHAGALSSCRQLGLR